MNNRKLAQELAALRALAMDDILAASDEELRAEAAENREDINALSAQVDSAMRQATAAARRQRLSHAKQRMESTSPAVVPRNRPTLAQAKELIKRAFAADPHLGLAFREGNKQTEADWMSLYDDLVALGAIKPDIHGD